MPFIVGMSLLSSITSILPQLTLNRDLNDASAKCNGVIWHMARLQQALAATDNNAAEAIVLVETPAFAEGRTKVIPAATAEEEDDYHQAGTTFDQCKICYDGMKDTQVNPCGHLLCSECAKTVAALETALNAQPKCPFCRVSITSLGWVKIEQKPAELPAEVATGGGGGAAAAAAPTKFAPDYFHGAVPNSAAIGRATAQYDYTPVADAEIPIKKGDVIFIFATEAQYVNNR